MKFKLKDYRDTITEFELPLDHFRGNKDITIIYTIQSGDEVVYLYYQSNLLKTFDSSNTRMKDYLDEIKPITFEELKLLNQE